MRRQFISLGGENRGTGAGSARHTTLFYTARAPGARDIPRRAPRLFISDRNFIKT
jgi:hypothetical protein